MTAPATDSNVSILAIAIEPGRLAAGLVDSSGSVLVRDRVSMPSRDVWRSLERLVRRVLAAAPDALADFDVVGVSCIGPIDVQSGTVSPPHIPSWHNFTLRDHLEALTSKPVVLDTTGGGAVEAERWVGEAIGVSSFISIVASEVVDSAGVINGRRLSGAHGNALDLAHVNVDPGGRACWCGATGCLDPYISAIALESEMSRPLRRANSSIVERAGIMLGHAISTIAAIVDVDTVFITGLVVDAFGDPMIETCRQEIARRSRLPNLSELRVIEPVEHISPLVRAAAVGRLYDAGVTPG